MKKILIANRGEIALRIVRACREIGIRSVAIYTEADRYALHVKKADESYNIGPESLAAYLNVQRIIQVAKSAGADAIHPGYGFLSENPELARACEQHGLTFIGPSADIIEKMGNKIAARKSMQAAGVPVIPGSDDNVASLEEAIKIANQIGYPVMLKATAGGGGRGLRRCDSQADLELFYERVISEASKAFGQSDVFIEKYIENPRHIEVQIMADKFGHVIHCFERDCSIQRRHQKLIEIAPSPQLRPEQREHVCELAVQCAKAVNYENAGTVEFIFTQGGDFYFLEMNTRIQVEHPVTEQITGLDLVQMQCAIAAGDKISLQQKDIAFRGYAIEFRVNCEDPQNDFLPSFGRITKYYAPGGPGVRADSAIYTGYKIPHDYDSLCAKVICWALDWESVIARSLRVLREMRLYGVKTTIPYYVEILKSKDFVKAKFDTSFVEQHPELTQYSNRRASHHRVAAIAAAIAAQMDSDRRTE